MYSSEAGGFGKGSLDGPLQAHLACTMTMIGHCNNGASIFALASLLPVAILSSIVIKKLPLSESGHSFT